jgi:hypothetical protein
MSADDSGDLLSADDVAFGFVAGVLPEASWSRVTDDPTSALTAAMRPALERAPCVIGFSGGRDSSLLLALAVHEARRAGLAPPIPVTLEFESENSQEREWQELVLSHLGVEDWVRLPQGAELDLVGPVARSGLLQHGLLYPGNAHMVVPLASVAPGGSVITGFAGDDVLGEWPFEQIAAMVARRRAPRRADLKALARWVEPASARSDRYASGRRWVQLPWLRATHLGRPDAVVGATPDVARLPAGDGSARRPAWRADVRPAAGPVLPRRPGGGRWAARHRRPDGGDAIARRRPAPAIARRSRDEG